LVLKIFNSEALDDRLFVKMVRAANVNSGHGIDLKKLLKHSIFLQNEFEFGMILKFFPRTCVLGTEDARVRGPSCLGSLSRLMVRSANLTWSWPKMHWV
jgi:hypothetical protein